MADETYTLSDVRAMSGNANPETYSLSDVQKMAAGPTFAETMLRRETSDLSANLRRGARDVIDTGAEGLAYAWDKLTGADPDKGEYARVKKMNEVGKAEWAKANEGLILPELQRLGGNMVATVPATAALGTGVVAAGLPRLGQSIATAGMTTGGAGSRLANVGIRAAGGAVNGAVSAGMVDPSSAATGAVIGGATPPVLQGLAAGSGAVRNAIRMRGDVGLARDIAQLADVQPTDLAQLATLRNALRQEGPTLISGAELTAPQIIQAPGVSQLQRSVKAAGSGALTAREAQQSAARMEVLNRIAPVSGTVQQAAEDAGNSIARFSIPAEASARRNVNALFDAIPSDEAMVQLPLSQMEAARTQFLGPGTFGKGGRAVDAAIDEASSIGTRRALGPELEYSSSDLARNVGRVNDRAGPSEMQAVPFDQLQKLRSSIGEAITEAKRNGQNQAQAALVQMKNAIDNKVADVAMGNASPGEVFTPQAIDAWGQALKAHAAKKLQFNTGPQAAMFRQGADGMPQIQGAEIPGKFFSSSRSQVENAQAFRRLVADNPALMADLRRYAITDAAGQVDRFGNLTNSKFNRWLDARSGATGEIFNDQQRATLKAVAENLRTADLAENLGRSSGSDTAQKAANMLRLGLMDSGPVNYTAGKIPGGRAVLDFFRGPAQARKAERIGSLLAEPEKLAGFLDGLLSAQQPKPEGLLMLGAPSMYRGAPLLYSRGGAGGGE